MTGVYLSSPTAARRAGRRPSSTSDRQAHALAADESRRQGEERERAHVAEVRRDEVAVRLQRAPASGGTTACRLRRRSAYISPFPVKSSRSQSTTTSAPSERTSSTFFVFETAVTCAPVAFASCNSGRSDRAGGAVHEDVLPRAEHRPCEARACDARTVRERGCRLEAQGRGLCASAPASRTQTYSRSHPSAGRRPHLQRRTPSPSSRSPRPRPRSSMPTIGCFGSRAGEALEKNGLALRKPASDG